jgi:hypothetical protein
LNNSSSRGSPQEIPCNELLVQSGHQTDPWLGASGWVANGREVIRTQRGWNRKRGQEQQGGKPQQSFLHGVISFSGELRRDNVLVEGVLFAGLE